MNIKYPTEAINVATLILTPRYKPSNEEKETLILATPLIHTTSLKQKAYCVLNGLEVIPVCECGNSVEFAHTSTGAKFRVHCSKSCSNIALEVKRQDRILEFGEAPKCKMCDTVVTFDSGNQKYRIYCSPTCGYSDQDSKARSVTSARHAEYRKKRVDGFGKAPKCKMCDNEVVFNSGEQQYKTYCSRACVDSDVYTIRAKADKTSTERYGTTRPQRLEEFKQKSRDTNLERYGTETPQALQERKDKVAKTNVEVYGVEFPHQNEEVRNKTKDTNLERFGYTNPRSAPEIKQKIKDTNLERYDRESHTQQHLTKDTISKLNDCEWLKYEHHTNKKPLALIADEIGCDLSTVGTRMAKFSIEVKNYFTSIGENQVADFMESNGLDLIRNTRSIIPPLELDIYIPEHNLAIEYCGLYWHSEQQGKDRNYHRIKHDRCKELGIQLITLYEDEWMTTRTQVCNKLLSLCNMLTSSRVYARKTKIVDVSTKKKGEFFDANHLQGSGPGSIVIGLESDGVLVACMCFIKQKDQHYLSRYATSCSVIGGFSKLLNHFKKNHDWELLISFADQRWSDGHLYAETGWVVDKVIPPDYYYSPDGKTRHHKFTYRRIFLEDKLDHFDSDLSEWENCKANGVLRIWDCGKIRYIMKNA